MGDARKFVPALESVRGIAALAVLFGHACWGLAGGNWELLQRTVWELSGEALLRRVILAVFNGNAAVSLFFVLSGFVLALSLDRDARAFPRKAIAFAGRRVLRIYPALAVNLVLAAVVLAALAAPTSSPHPTAGDLRANLLLVRFDVNGPTWTMLVELLAVPLLLVCHLVASRFGLRGLLAMVALCIAGLFEGHRVM